MQAARKFFVSGDVQGVGYRHFAQRASARHQVVGYAKNLPDGRVEVVAEGSDKSVDEFRLDLAAGPSYSRVAGVEELVIDVSGRFTAFRIDR